MKLLLDTQAFLWFVLNDRLLVAQALTEKMPIISVDAVLDDYAVTRYW